MNALLRMAVVRNIPIAWDRASADFMISSPLMDKRYLRLVPDYDVSRAGAIPENVSTEVAASERPETRKTAA